MVEMYIQGMAISQALRNGLLSRNMEALIEMQNRMDNGMNLSSRVWHITDQTKTQLEFYLKSGLSVGRSAAGISQDIRNILEEPDRLFRRVRGEDGILSHPSQ